MKHIILMLAFVLTSMLCFAEETNTSFDHNRQVIGEFVDQYRATKEVSIIEIGPAMIRMLAVNQFEKGNDETAKLLRMIDSIEIMVDGGVQPSFRSDMFMLPERCKEYELITSIDNDQGGISRFYIASHTLKCEFLMLVDNGDKLILLTIVGEFTVADISALSSLSDGIM